MNENRISESENQYTHGHADAVLRSHRWRTAENSAAYLLASLRPGMRLLDVGCGPGTLTADLAARVAPGATLGIDLSPSVIAEATEAAADTPGLTFAVADLHAVDPPSGGFDVVHAHQVLQHVEDPVAALRAMGSLLAPDGLVAARDADYSAMTWWPEEPALDRWLEIYRAVTKRNGAECDAGRRLLHWAHDAGFEQVDFTSSTWTYSTTADLAWWCDLWAERVTSTRLAEQAVTFAVSTADELAEIATGWRSWGQRADAVFIVPHGEIVARRPA